MAFGILRNLLKRRAATAAPQPGGEDALLQRAIAHHQAGRLDEAEQAYLEILRDAPQHPVALHHLGLIAMQSENFDLAHELIVESLAKDPADIRARENLGQVLRALGRIDEAIDLYRATLATAPEAARIHSALCFASCFSARYDAQAIFAEHCAWAQRFAPAAAAGAYGNPPEPERRLRLGYVAFNFSNFIIGCYLEEVFRHHDRAAFEVFLYHNGKWQGPWSERLRRQAEHWREIGGMDDAAAADAIRADGIDVLVDLSGHLGDNRLLTFARKPAPVQVSWLSYPATTGLAAMDYRLTDSYCDPPGLTEHLYTEKLHRLPHTWWCYHPAIVSPITPLPALRNGWITFGSFNAYAKISEPAIELWARLLAALPQARLFIMTVPRGSATAALRERFQGMGIAPERLEIEASVIPDRFHEMFARADIALDPFPCNGGATTLDALWNGLPVITLAGTTCVSRAGVSMLSNAGLDDLIARDKDDYLAIARRLAADPNALQSLRSGLRARLQASPIMNAAAFTADLEAAYRHMWRRWCEGAKPAEFEAAIRLHESGDLDAAEMRYRTILQADPHNPDATHLLGLIAHQRGDHAAAVAQIGAAIALQADKAAYHANLGNALAALARYAPAVASYRKALRLAPDHALARHNLGTALAQSGEFIQAADEFRRAAAARPSAETRYALAGALIAIADRDPCRADRYEEAAAELRAIWQETADPVEARTALAYCLQQLKRWTEAAEHYEAALALRPDSAKAHNNLANCYHQLGRIVDAVFHFRETYRLAPDFPEALASVIACLNYDPGCTPEQSLAEHRIWAERVAAPHYPGEARHANDRDPERRLRIGYVSPDFRRHPVSAIFAPVLAAHDPGQVEVTCYYNHAVEDAVTLRLKSLARQWRAVAAIDDAALCEQIRADRIDILVDLAGHTGFSRLLAFAHKPAPVQVSWLGYFNTTGLATMDYFLSDPWSSPPGQERYYVERLLRLPHTRFCYEPPAYMPGVSPPPWERAGHITFGSLHNLAKLNDQVLTLWSQLLQAVPDSRLLVQTAALDDSANRQRLRARWGRLGIAPERLDLRGFSPIEQVPAAYAAIDVALDPFPFCGGMTSFEALWLGVPVITLAGPSIASRQSASMLANLGLHELIATDAPQYLAKAAELVLHPQRLAALRAGLRPRFAASPLMDYAGFTRSLEAAYRQMWRDWASRNRSHHLA